MSLYDWSVTAANNDNADANINWTEGQNANTVNNSARAQMAAVAAFLEQINGAGTTGGSGNAYTFTSASGNAITAYAAGNMICFKANHTITGGATLNVDGLGAKTLKKFGDTDLVANDIETGFLVLAIYDGTNFQILSPVAHDNLAAFSALTAATDKLPYFDSATTMALNDFSPLAQGLLADTTAAAMRTTLALVIGTDVLAYNAGLQAVADLGALGANRLVYSTGSGNYAVTPLEQVGRNFLDDTTATAQRATIGVPENTRNITYGTAAPGTLGTGDIYLRHN